MSQEMQTSDSGCAVSTGADSLVDNTNQVSPDTQHSLARCLFGRLVRCSPFFQITDFGRMVLAPVFESPETRFLAAEDELDESDRTRLAALRDKCLPVQQTVLEEVFIERFCQGMINGELAELPYLAPLINSPAVVDIIQHQLLQLQLPLVDFLHSLAVLVKNRMESAGLLEMDSRGRIMRPD